VGKLLIGGQNPFVIASLREAARGAGHDVCGIAPSARTLVALAAREKPDLAIIDVQLANGDSGVEAAIEVSKRTNARILFLTTKPSGVSDPPSLIGNACLRRPFTRSEAIAALQGLELIETTKETAVWVSQNLPVIE
jgi:two-component system, response regulator PdtaR